MAKAASITAGLVTKKGEAAPSINVIEPAVPVRSNPDKVKEYSYYKALTVKLDRPHYEALKLAGLKHNKKSQDIFVEALELWLSENRENR